MRRTVPGRSRWLVTEPSRRRDAITLGPKPPPIIAIRGIPPPPRERAPPPRPAIPPSAHRETRRRLPNLPPARVTSPPRDAPDPRRDPPEGTGVTTAASGRPMAQ